MGAMKETAKMVKTHISRYWTNLPDNKFRQLSRAMRSTVERSKMVEAQLDLSNLLLRNSERQHQKLLANVEVVPHSLKEAKLCLFRRACSFG